MRIFRVVKNSSNEWVLEKNTDLAAIDDRQRDFVNRLLATELNYMPRMLSGYEIVAGLMMRSFTGRDVISPEREVQFWANHAASKKLLAAIPFEKLSDPETLVDGARFTRLIVQGIRAGVRKLVKHHAVEAGFFSDVLDALDTIPASAPVKLSA